MKSLITDWKIHSTSGARRAFIALLVYRYGRFAASIPFWPARKLLGLVYTILQPVAEFISGVSLHRNTNIGKEFHIIHPGIIHIHPDTVFGDRVGIQHGVTTGIATDGPGTPIIGNDVYIGCNATIVGGVRIGDRAVIAANSLVLSDVPDDSLAIGVPAKVVPANMRAQLRKAS